MARVSKQHQASVRRCFGEMVTIIEEASPEAKSSSLLYNSLIGKYGREVVVDAFKKLRSAAGTQERYPDNALRESFFYQEPPQSQVDKKTIIGIYFVDDFMQVHDPVGGFDTDGVFQLTPGDYEGIW